MIETVAVPGMSGRLSFLRKICPDPAVQPCE
jgi:hypothetical protein